MRASATSHFKILPSKVDYFNTICSHVIGTSMASIWWIAMEFGIDIHVFQIMKSTHFSDPLTLIPPAPPVGQSFHVSTEISQYLPYGLAQNLVQTFMIPTR